MKRSMVAPWLAALAFAFAAPAAAQSDGTEPQREVPPALVPILNAAQRALEADDAPAALRILATYDGAPDPLHRLLAGYAHMDLDQLTEAEAAFRSALELDDGIEQARTGLARSLVAQEKWSDAIGVLREVVDVERSPAVELGLYARAAYESGDLRLASLLAERGVLRFPADLTLRRIDLEVLVRRGAWNDALEAALSLLASEPTDPLAWRQLAAAADRVAPELALPALEAASLAAPDDAAVSLRFARRLYDLGDYGRVVAWAQARLDGRGERVVPPGLRQLALSAAVRAGDWSAAADWAGGEDDALLHDDLVILARAHRRLAAGEVEPALELFAEVASRRRLPTDEMWQLVGAARRAGRPGLRTYFARATLARCDPWAPAAAAVLAAEAGRDLDPDVLLEASCGDG
jgi:tetratricopeptide (TPR) repeat protein